MLNICVEKLKVEEKKLVQKNQGTGWMDGRKDGRMDGWVGGKARLRIAYSNRKPLKWKPEKINAFVVFICPHNIHGNIRFHCHPKIKY